VVVAHDAARLLPGLVNAVREQTHPVQRVIGVDTGSQDRSGATLTELLGQDAVFGMEQDTGYGAAVASALQRPAAAQRAVPSGSGCCDDCELPDALSSCLLGQLEPVGCGPGLSWDLSDGRGPRERASHRPGW
jgi:glycosyltransferase involved in cell wall biosynthesis